MDILFTVDPRLHGTGSIVFSWHPESLVLASTGNSRVVHVFDRRGNIVEQIVPPSPSIVTALEWDRNGEILAIVQAHATVIVLWNLRAKTTRHFDVGTKDITFIKWSKIKSQLAIGTSKGSVFIYNAETNVKSMASSKHKKRIISGDWNLNNRLAYASDDRQITICTEEGGAVDQVKVKCRPLSVTFGGKVDDNEQIISVNMEGQTILLYDIQEQDNALELAFQKRYGKIVSYRWFGNGYIIAGFSSGYVVIISTHMHEIGQEQYCANLFNDQLRDLSYCEKTGLLATCGEQTLKVINMSDWKEVACEELEKETGDSFEHLAWTLDGRLLSVSSRSGCLYTFAIHGIDKNGIQQSKEISIWKLMLQPLSVFAAISTVFSICLLILLIACSYFQVTPMDFIRALFGFAESF